MAPISLAKIADDDFILTLSDDENIGAKDYKNIYPGIRGSPWKTSKSKLLGTKRKRDEPGDDNESLQSGESKKSRKQRRSADKAKGDAGFELDVTGVESDEDIEEEDDGALDPDFEFDVGGAGDNELVHDFDGWGANDRVGVKTTGNKKTVDIDDIVSRRQQRKNAEAVNKKGAEAETYSSKAEIESESELDWSDFPDFEDDELLAPDAFGMGAARESGDSVEGESADPSEAESGGTGASDVGDEHPERGSDDDSVASPVVHPDDLDPDEGSGPEIEDPVEIEKQKNFFAAEDTSTRTTKPDSAFPSSFQNFSLSRPILRGLASVGFSTPTPIQRKTIPVALLGKDIVGGAVTGSGKTAAFIIPILERLLYRPRRVPTSRVAILMPTRELAVQCYNVTTKLATFTDITFCQLVGGFSLREQESVLKKRPDVIIATPGRFIDHMRNSASFTVDTLEILVLDEADRMLEDGFADELNEILMTIPKSRQTMLFSATMTDSVDKLIRVGLNKPVRLMVDAKKQTVGTLVQEFVRLRPGREDKRLGSLLLLCKTVYTDRVIVFFRQKREAHRVRVIFSLCGLKAAELHGSMSQEQRIKSVEDFRDGRVSFLLATDVASRGLDIKGVETVINYEAPQTHEIYLHRVGRTARAGRAGRACTLAAESDRKVVKAAVKSGRAQGAKILSRVIDPTAADRWAAKVEEMQEEVNDILREEREEKQLARAEMEVTRGENLIRHEREIMSRPKRTWFESEKEKMRAKRRGRIELNGADSVRKNKTVKLSGKDKKKLDDSRERKEGKVWKKGKSEREHRPTMQDREKRKSRPSKHKGKRGEAKSR